MTRRRPATAARIRRVVSGQHVEHAGEIAHFAGEHPGHVDRRRQRHHAVSREQPVRGLEAEHAICARRQSHRAAAVAAERRVHEARCDRRSRAARGSAGDVRGVPRIAAVAERLVVTGGSERELRHVQRAELQRAGGVEALEQRRGPRGRHRVAGPRSVRGNPTGTIEHVLVREQGAVECGSRIDRWQAVATRGLRTRRLGVEAHEGIDPRLPVVDAREARIDELAARHAPGRERMHRRAQAPLAGIVHGGSARVSSIAANPSGSASHGSQPVSASVATTAATAAPAPVAMRCAAASSSHAWPCAIASDRTQAASSARRRAAHRATVASAEVAARLSSTTRQRRPSKRQSRRYTVASPGSGRRLVGTAALADRDGRELAMREREIGAAGRVQAVHHRARLRALTLADRHSLGVRRRGTVAQQFEARRGDFLQRRTVALFLDRLVQVALGTLECLGRGVFAARRRGRRACNSGRHRYTPRRFERLIERLVEHDTPLVAGRITSPKQQGPSAAREVTLRVCVGPRTRAERKVRAAGDLEPRR